MDILFINLHKKSELHRVLNDPPEHLLSVNYKQIKLVPNLMETN